MSKFVRLEEVKKAFSESLFVVNRETAEEITRILRDIKNKIEELQTFDFDQEIYYLKGLQDGRRDMAELLLSGFRDTISELIELREEKE